MNKKADTTALSFVGSLIITAFIVIALIGLIYIILPKSGQQEDDTIVFYYKTFSRDLKEMKDTKNLTFLSNKNYALVGFDKSLNEITNLDPKCGLSQVTGKIVKPNSCQGNACLCLCNVDTQIVFVEVV